MFRHFVLSSLAVAASFLGVPSIDAQSVLDLPRPSQQARVMQRIGITNITISYHRPLVNGRKVWGNLVPYGQVWRAGANENTTIEFSDPVAVDGKPLPKGIYGLFMIPGENEWTVIFSKNSTSWGGFTYDQAEDALRVTLKPQPTEFHEALTYDFDDVKPDSTVVTLRWEKLAMPFTVGVNVNEIVQQSLSNQVRAWSRWMWEGWDEAANYLLSQKLNLEDALNYSNQSIQVEERFDNLLTKSRVLEALNRGDEATATRDKAMGMASALQLYSYGRSLQSQGQEERALEIYRINIQKHPNDWIIHAGAARIASAQHDFDKAVKEMKLAMAGAPDQYKPSLERLRKRLEAKEDINK
jgi:tetratricopeptide (TPR) repeat protein